MAADNNKVSKEEQQLFSSWGIENYLDTRSDILWRCKEGQLITLQDCIPQGLNAHRADQIKTVYNFLQSHGLVNFGTPVPSKEDIASAKAAEKQAAAEAKRAVYDTKIKILQHLYPLLKESDLQTVTEKQVRNKLQEQLGIELKEYRSFIKKYVGLYIGLPDEEASKLLPELTASDAEQDKAGSDDDEDDDDSDQGPVIVVGAGAAGLAAATTLQRGGVDVIVLEAENKTGGRSIAPTGPATDSSSELQQKETQSLDLAPLPLLPQHLFPHLSDAACNVAPDLQVGHAFALLKQLAGHQGAKLPSVEAETLKSQVVSPASVPWFDSEKQEWLTSATCDQACKLIEELFTEVSSSASKTDAAQTPILGPLQAALQKRTQAVAIPAQVDDNNAGKEADKSAKETAAAALDAVQSAAESSQPQEGAVQTADTSHTVADDKSAAEAKDGQPDQQDKDMEEAGKADVKDETMEAKQPAAEQSAAQDTEMQDVQGNGQSDSKPDQSDTKQAEADAKNESDLQRKEDHSKTSDGKETTSLPSQVTRLAQCILPMLCATTGQTLASLPLSQAASIQLLTQQPADQPTASPTQDKILLGIHLPTTSLSQPGGFQEQLLAGLPMGLDVHYNHRVVEVKVEKRGGVTVTTDSGEKFEGRAVLLTVPDACLSGGSNKIRISPVLPDWKASALANLTTSHDQTVCVLQAQSAQPLQHLLQQQAGTPVPNGGKVFGILPSMQIGTNSQKAANNEEQQSNLQQPVLVGELQQQDSNVMTLLAISSHDSKEKLTLQPSQLSACLQAALPGLTVTQDATTSVASSHTVTHAESACGVRDNDIASTIAPVKQAIFFAGSWCPPVTQLIGSTAGALLSGVREARRIMRMMTDNDAAINLLVANEKPADEKALKAAHKARQKREGEGKKRQQDAASEGEGASKKKARRLSPESESGSSEEEEDESLKKVAAAKGQKGKKRKLKKGGEGDEEGDIRAKRTRAADNKLPEPYDAERHLREQKRYEEARQDIKVVIKAMYSAESGDTEPLLAVMATCTHLDAQAGLMQQLSRAKPAALDNMAKQPKVLKQLNEWLKDWVASKSEEHLAKAMLQVLCKLNVPNSGMLKAAGLLETVKTRCMESSLKDIKTLGQEVWAFWTKRFKAAAATAGAGAANKGVVPLSLMGTTRPSLPMPLNPTQALPVSTMLPPSLPPSLPTSNAQQSVSLPPSMLPPSMVPPSMAPAKTAQQPTSQAAENKAETASVSRPEQEPSRPAVDLSDINPVLAAQLAEQEEKMRQTEAALQEAAMRRAAAAAVAAQASTKLPTIHTFDEYAGKKLAEREKAKQSRDKQEGKSSKPTNGAPSRGLSSEPEQVDEDGHSSEGVAALRDYVGRLLKPAHMDKQITSAQFRDIRDKVVSKVCEVSTVDKTWLDGPEHRKKKVKDLVDRYLTKPPS